MIITSGVNRISANLRKEKHLSQLSTLLLLLFLIYILCFN